MCLLNCRQRYFNPHEREARDPFRCVSTAASNILIHTSVKLVTILFEHLLRGRRYFNPHEREARDMVGSKLD